MNKPLIAIVIPAFKPNFLAATLASIAQQELKNFKVYVGDDASPADLWPICAPFAEQFDLHYKRFECNLGQHDLVAHWNRCVRLSAEPWVWLFSDDDVLDPACSARLQQGIALHGAAVDVFHFNVTKIDGSGAVLGQLPVFAPQLSGRAFVLGRLQFALHSFAPDFVFARAAFERVGGFVNFPLAWCADDASWVAMAGDKGICTLAGPQVHWRLSGLNISAKSPASQAQLLEAQVQYLIWLHQHLLAHPAPTGDVADAQIWAVAPWWLFKQLDYMQARLTIRQAVQLAWRLRHLPGQSLWRWLARAARAMVQQGVQ